jgi:oxygen-dependent protoporphyrinogen oxidase
MRVVVVGAGISGLTSAYLARAAGHEVTCVDPGAQPGGVIRSERIDGFLCEVGPQAVLDDASDTTALIAALGLSSRVLRAAPEARRRFIFARGALRPLPTSPPGLLSSGLLSPLGKLRLLAEPLIPARRPAGGADDDAETLTAFGNRRIGREATRRLLATAVIGIYAADASRLSAASAFPRLVALEREHGSLFRGILAARKGGRRPGHSVSFPNGLGELPGALDQALGEARIRGSVTALESRPGGRWRMTVEGGAVASLDAEAVVLAPDAETSARLLLPVASDAAAALSGLPTTPIAVCCLGFRDANARTLGMDLAAYGFLVARGEHPRLLGCQYESSTFSGRAPPGGVLLRALVGGSGPGFEPELVNQPDDVIAARALGDLRIVAGLRRDPDLVRVWRHPNGIPLYAPGHAARVTAVDAALRRHPGLYVVGHGLRGVGVNESIRAATMLVNRDLSTVR